MRCINARTVLNPKKDMTPDDLPYIMITCKKCAGCLQRYKMEWANRLIEHGRNFNNKFFCDITYDELSLPILNTENHDIKPLASVVESAYPCYSDLVDCLDSKIYYPTLWKQEVVKFIKRLRKSLPWKFTYWLCGEYGEQKDRPHYHFLLFVDTPKDIILHHDDIYAFISEAWKRGFPSVFPVSDKDIRYTCKYSLKQQLPKDFPAVKPFMLCSNGIGRAYAESVQVQKYHSDSIDRIYYPLSNKIKSYMPRYWKDRLFSEATRKEYQKQVLVKSGIPTSILEHHKQSIEDRIKLINKHEEERKQIEYETKLIDKQLRNQSIPKKIPQKLI